MVVMSTEILNRLLGTLFLFGVRRRWCILEIVFAVRWLHEVNLSNTIFQRLYQNTVQVLFHSLFPARQNVHCFSSLAQPDR